MLPIPKAYWEKLSGANRQRILYGAIILVVLSATFWVCALLYSSYSNTIKQQYIQGYNSGVLEQQKQYEDAIKEANKQWTKELEEANRKAQEYYELSKESLNDSTIQVQQTEQKLIETGVANRNCIPDWSVQEYNKAFGKTD